MWKRNQTNSANRFYIWKGGIKNPAERAGIIPVLLIFYRNGILFMDEDGFSNGLRVEVGLRDAGAGGLEGGGETDVVV